MATAPNVANYRIGKGVLHFTPDGGSPTHLGNAPSFVYTPDIQKKDHFSSMGGVKTKDLTRITQVGATVKITLEEINGFNLAMFVLSDDSETDSSGNIVLRGLSQTQFTGLLEMTGTNDIGQQVDFSANVSFVPAGDFNFITDTDDYSQLEVQAEVLVDENGDYGVWTIRDTAESV